VTFYNDFIFLSNINHHILLLKNSNFAAMKIFRNNISFFKSLSVATLLGIYISALLFNNLHPYLHQDHSHQESCSIEAEKDPCHQRAFHHNLVAGCKHETHILASQTVCQLCDAIIAKYYFPNEKTFKKPEKKLIQNALIFEEPFIFKFSTTSRRLRGPPSLLPFFA